MQHAGLSQDGWLDRELAGKIARVARADVGVLITGESGTGKTLAARALHDESARRHQPFVAVNCSALQLDEAHPGSMRSAQGGTLFLDEIGDLSPSAQAQLLRMLEPPDAPGVPGTTQARFDARIVTSTNRNLDDMVAEGRFRDDLLYRLRVVTLGLPPLRERVGAIPKLIAHFLAVFAARHQLPVRAVDAAAFAILMQYHWPGNVRELRNVIEGALVLADGACITSHDLPAALTRRADTTITSSVVNAQSNALSFVEARERAMREFDRAFLGAALARHGGNVARTARALGLHRQSLQKLIARRALRSGQDASWLGSRSDCA